MEKVKKMLSLAFASLFRRNKGQNTVKEKRQRSHQINMPVSYTHLEEDSGLAQALLQRQHAVFDRPKAGLDNACLLYTSGIDSVFKQMIVILGISLCVGCGCRVIVNNLFVGKKQAYFALILRMLIVS